MHHILLENYEGNETRRKHERKEDRAKDWTAGGRSLGLRWSHLVGAEGNYKVTLRKRGEAKSMTGQYFMVPFKKQQSKEKQ